MKISTRIRTIKKKSNKIHEEIRDIQDNVCTHPNMTFEYKSGGGGWSNPKTSYWKEFECPDCQKRWHSETEYD